MLQRTNPLLRSATETGTCPVRDAPQTEIKGLREAELVNHILAAALRYDLSIGANDALMGEVEMRTDDGTSAGTVKIKAVDARYPVVSPAATCWRYHAWR